MSEAIGQRAIVLAGLKAHEVESRLNIAYWSQGGDVEYHIEAAQKAFSDLASLLGYTLIRVGDDPENRLLKTLKAERGIYVIQSEPYTARALDKIIKEFESARSALSPDNSTQKKEG